jgi:hypothetical protein
VLEPRQREGVVLERGEVEAARNEPAAAASGASIVAKQCEEKVLRGLQLRAARVCRGAAQEGGSAGGEGRVAVEEHACGVRTTD